MTSALSLARFLMIIGGLSILLFCGMFLYANKAGIGSGVPSLVYTISAILSPFAFALAGIGFLLMTILWLWKQNRWKRLDVILTAATGLILVGCVWFGLSWLFKQA